MFVFLRAWLPLLLLFWGLNACQETPKPDLPKEEPTPAPALERRFFQTKTTRLRIRQTPDLEGAVLEILPEGSLVEYLHDSTSFTTSITYNRTTYDVSWYKIKTDAPTEGWVYSAFLQGLSEARNQQIITQREAAALAEAANKEQAEQLALPTEEEQQEQLNEGLLRAYKSTLNQLSKQDPQAVGQAVNRYKSLLVNRASKRTHDAAYVAFRQWYDQVLQQLRQRYKGQFQHLAPELKRYQRIPMTSQPTLMLLGDNGFNFALNNNQVVLAEDTDWIFRTFYREVSTPMRGYMNQYELEEPNFWYQNNELLITPTQLARWILSWNYFVATYPDFVWHNDALRRLTIQLDLLLEGTDKQPAFGDNQTLTQPYQEAYTYIAEGYPNSNIGKAFQRYLDVLADNDQRSNTTVRNAQQQLRKALLK